MPPPVQPPEALFPTVRPATPTEQIIPRIVIASRTHLQLQGLTRELKQSPYAAVNMTTLSSRKHSCINNEVKDLGAGAGPACLSLLRADGEGCPTRRTKPLKRHGVCDSSWDIEDLVAAGHTTRSCPYYTAHELQATAALILATHAHLVTDSGSSTISGCVVVLDEGHHLADLLQSSASMALTEDTLTQSLATLESAASASNVDLRPLICNISAAIASILCWQQEHSELAFDSHDGRFPLASAQHTWLSDVCMNDPERFADDVTALKTAYQEGLCPAMNIGVLTLLTKLSTVCVRLQAHPEAYDVAAWYVSGQRELHITCVSAAPCYNRIFDDAHAVIIISATLGCFDVLSTALGHRFPVRLRVGDFMQPGQVLPLTVTECLQGDDLRLTAAALRTAKTQDALGVLVLASAHFCNAGTVVFFPSQATLRSLITQWQLTSAWAELHAHHGGHLYIEASTDGWPSYKSAVQGGFKPVLFAAMRSKLAEGESFNGDLARLIITIGVPFLDPRTPATSSRLAKLEAGGFSSFAWSINDAMRCVCQALGRGVRGADDWCAFLLIDSRLANPGYNVRLPRWARQGPFDSTSTALAELESYFNAK